MTQSESAPHVRGLDTARLAAWMDEAALRNFPVASLAPAGRGEPLQTRFLSGGTQNVIYKISRGEHVCAMRMPPAGAPPDRDKGILREWQIIDALDGT